MVRIFLAGGYGKTARALGTRLSRRPDVNLVLSSRSGVVPVDYKHDVVAFDWLKPATHAAPFQKGPIDAVYIVNTNRTDTLAEVKPFIDLAIEKGTRRFVLLSRANSSYDDKDGHALVWRYFDERKVDYTILMPHWFMENLLSPRYIKSICEESAIFGISGTSDVPWIAVDDIAAAAEQGLLVEKSSNKPIILTGSEQTNYIQLAEIFSRVIDQKISYKDKTEAELQAFIQSSGLPPPVVQILLYVEKLKLESGVFPISQDFEKFTGKKPITLEQFITQHKQVFA